MSYPYGGTMTHQLTAPLPPPPMMPPLPMMPQQNYENMNANYGMNQGMMMPGLNDAPLEFNMAKNMPPMPMTVDESQQQRRVDESDNMDMGNQQMSNQNQQNNQDSNRGNNRRRSHDRDDRDSRRRDRKDHGDDKDRRDRGDRSRNSYRRDGERGGSGSRKPKISESSDSLNGQRAPAQSVPAPQPGMMFNGMYGNGMAPMGMGMMMDPSMMGQFPDPSQMNAMQMMGPDGMPMAPTALPMGMMPMPTNFPMAGAVKETIVFKSCTLFPPFPSSQTPATRDRPPGCRTVFVGGLPENITEEILTEIFLKCGEITSMRLSKKNFCHIRFVYEESIDGAIFLSGYRIRLDNKTDPPNNGRLHVDYAQARDDQHEWELKQRAAMREQRHRERLMERQAKRDADREAERHAVKPVHHFTDHEAAAISEKIKQDEHFQTAVQVVITWLERGDCSKRNVNVFYSMIQSTNSHVRRLLNEKMLYEDELQRAKDEAKTKMQGILEQFSKVEKVFAAASHKKVWDHFTKAQRKNIDMWKKQSTEIRTIQLEDFLQETGAEEMDVSDTDDADSLSPRKRAKIDVLGLKEDNDNLKCQLEAYKNEIDLLKAENMSDLEAKEQSIKQLRARTLLLESQLTQAKRAQASEAVKLMAMSAKLSAKARKEEGEDRKTEDGGTPPLSDLPEKIENKPFELGDSLLTDREAKLIGIISTFLHIHPFGASTDYLWSYVQKMESSLRPNQLEDLLNRFPTVFIQETSGVGANIERKWVFTGFNTAL